MPASQRQAGVHGWAEEERAWESMAVVASGTQPPLSDLGFFTCKLGFKSQPRGDRGNMSTLDTGSQPAFSRLKLQLSLLFLSIFKKNIF